MEDEETVTRSPRYSISKRMLQWEGAWIRSSRGLQACLTLPCSSSWEPLGVLWRGSHFPGGEKYMLYSKYCSLPEGAKPSSSLWNIFSCISSDGKKENHKREEDAQTPSAPRCAVYCHAVVSDWESAIVSYYIFFRKINLGALIIWSFEMTLDWQQIIIMFI